MCHSLVITQDICGEKKTKTFTKPVLYMSSSWREMRAYSKFLVKNHHRPVTQSRQNYAWSCSASRRGSETWIMQWKQFSRDVQDVYISCDSHYQHVWSIQGRQHPHMQMKKISGPDSSIGTIHQWEILFDPLTKVFMDCGIQLIHSGSETWLGIVSESELCRGRVWEGKFEDNIDPSVQYFNCIQEIGNSESTCR